MPQFVKDVEEIRQRAIRKIENGAVTEVYGVDKDHAIEILNEALATEIVCVLRYMHHYFMATGVHGKGVSDEFKEHADAEREHADRIAERIQQLGGKPDFNPKTLMERSASQYVEGETLADMIREDLIAERVVIEVYTEMIRYFGHKDPTTRHIIEEILADEEEHASDLVDLLYVVDPHTGEDRGQDPGTDPLNIGKRAPQRANGEGRMERKQNEQRGTTNREAAEDLQRGGLKQAERGNKSLKGRSRGEEDQDIHGHPKRKALSDELEDSDDNIRPAAAAGRTRSAHVTNPNKKRKRVA
jgi:bacterioferritin